MLSLMRKCFRGASSFRQFRRHSQLKCLCVSLPPPVQQVPSSRERPPARLLSINGSSPSMRDFAGISVDELPVHQDDFEMFKVYCNATNEIVVSKFLADLKSAGLTLTDLRLKECMEACTLAQEENLGVISFEKFKEAVSANFVIVQKALLRKMIIPEWEEFVNIIRTMYLTAKDNTAGEIATYIPQLARQNPAHWAVSVCTIDGQRVSFGDSNVPFCVQSCGKALNYALVLEDSGAEYVHGYVGQEPSGHSFNELFLNKQGKPHNPMINAGAMLICALMKPDMSMAEKFEWLSKQYQRMAANERIGFCNSTFQSEKQTADRNRALMYLMRDKKAFPQHGADGMEVLDFYFQTCAIEINSQSGALIAATLANGGICPITEEKVLSPVSVQHTLSLMLSCGMYDYSGQFAFEVGLPAKSGVAGGILLVIPNVAGICIFSPPLDEKGNSVRGLHFCKDLVKYFNFHHYDSLLQFDGNWDPRRWRFATKEHWVVSLLFSASKGDVSALRRYVASGMEPMVVDYDMRSALHIASAGGHLQCVQFLLSLPQVEVNAVDRWNRTALDDAQQFGHNDVSALLLQHGAVQSEKLPKN